MGVESVSSMTFSSSRSLVESKRGRSTADQFQAWRSDPQADLYACSLRLPPELAWCASRRELSLVDSRSMAAHSGPAVATPVEPMLTKLADELPDGAFLYETKRDGFRAIVFRGGPSDVVRHRARDRWLKKGQAVSSQSL